MNEKEFYEAVEKAKERMEEILQEAQASGAEPSRIKDLKKQQKHLETVKYPTAAMPQYTRRHLSRDVGRLLAKEPFWGYISSSLPKKATTEIPTAAIAARGRSVKLLYNPEFMRFLNEEERFAIFIHEFCHVLYKHVMGRNKDKDPKIWNVAADLAINWEIRDKLPADKVIPSCGVFPFNGCIPQQGEFKDFEPNLSTEAYYYKIWNDDEMREKMESKKITIKMPGGGGQGSGDGEGDGDGEEKEMSWGDQTLDEHDEWNDEQNGGQGQGKDGDGETDEDIFGNHEMESHLDDIVRRAMENCQRSSNWGSVPGSLQKKIEDRFRTTLNWKAILRQFVEKSQRADSYRTYKAVDRKQPYVFPGRKYNYQAKIGIAVDQSGSVDNELLGMFFAELSKMAEQAEFVYIPFDTRVEEEDVKIWRKDEKREAERVYCGGTDFNAPTEYVNGRRDLDGLIICTDMAAPEPIDCAIERMWITDKYNFENPYYDPRPNGERMVPITRPSEEGNDRW